jgi:hypothetical protein
MLFRFNLVFAKGGVILEDSSESLVPLYHNDRLTPMAPGWLGLLPPFNLPNGQVRAYKLAQIQLNVLGGVKKNLITPGKSTCFMSFFEEEMT